MGSSFQKSKLIFIKKLVSVILCIAPSNAFCERIFSLVSGVWTNEQNLFDTVNAIVSIKANSDFDCSNAYQLFLSNEDLLKAAKSDEKYNR
jgi:hypothetical protein